MEAVFPGTRNNQLYISAVKGKGLVCLLAIALFTRMEARDQQRFVISEVAAGWHELKITDKYNVYLHLLFTTFVFGKQLNNVIIQNTQKAY